MNEIEFDDLKNNKNQGAIYAFVKDLPKGGMLHVHLSGAIPVDVILSEAYEQNFYTKINDSKEEKVLRIIDRLSKRVEDVSIPWLEEYANVVRLPIYSLISGRQFSKLSDQTRYLYEHKILSRNLKPQWHYRPLSALSRQGKEKLRENLLLRELVPSGGASFAIGEDYKPTPFSLPEEFLKRFARVDGLVGDPNTMAKLLRKVLSDLHKDNVSYVELMVNPFDRVPRDKESVRRIFGSKRQAYLELTKKLKRPADFEMSSAEYVLQRFIDETNSFNDELEKSNDKNPDNAMHSHLPKKVEVRFLLGMQRGTLKTRERVSQCFKLVQRFQNHPLKYYKGRVPGLNLVGNEFSGQPADYLRLLMPYANGVQGHISLHAGESSVDDGHVLDSILLGAERLGHGLSLQYSPRAEEIVLKHGLCIEVCLLSNKFLGYVPSTEKHPARRWIQNGLRVCLNTDDPGIFDTTLTDEFYFAILSFDLSLSDIQKLCLQSLRCSFSSEKAKEELVADFLLRYNDYVENYKPAESV